MRAPRGTRTSKTLSALSSCALLIVVGALWSGCAPPKGTEEAGVTASSGEATALSTAVEKRAPAAPGSGAAPTPATDAAPAHAPPAATKGQWLKHQSGFVKAKGWGSRFLGRIEGNHVNYSGDLWGLWECDASHMYDGRPGFERVGCMVRLPGRDLRRAVFQQLGRRGDSPVERFLMGAQSTDPDAPGYDPEAGEDEAPPHEVTLSPYWLQRMEVTVRQYRWCLVSGPCRIEDVGVGGTFHFDGDLEPGQLGPQRRGDERPMNGVSWEGARRYCQWIGGRLPTEAEWEYAARGGGLHYRYPWGDEPPTCRRAVFKGTASRPCDVTSAKAEFTPDGHHTPSHILHQAGNLWEWTADWYAPDYYAQSPTSNPKGPKSGSGRVQRGGSYSDDDPAVLRGAFRAQMDPALKMPDVGFRCASDQVDHHPVTPLFSFTTKDLASWSKGIDDTIGTWRAIDGLMTAELQHDKETLRWHPVMVDDEGVLTVRIFPELEQKGSVALLYGVQDARNHYRAELYPASGVARLIRVLDGVEGIIGEASELSLPNRGWLSVHIRWRGGKHRLSHSALNLVHGDDSTWSKGGVGMRLKGPGKATFEGAFTTP
ncbi:MAG: formylglycine-generating enzyme family protein [Myxococcota bacterium]